MRIVTLVENTSIVSGCEPAHGLSLWIETACHKVLMDAGPSDVLLSNAKCLGVDLSKADTLILSHGHYDHTGGVLSFTALAPKASIYLRRTAGEPYYSGSSEDGTLHYIGMDPSIMELPQLRPVDGVLKIDEELTLFGDISGRRCWPESNLHLSRKAGDEYVQDRFDHEQCLVIRENGLSVLLTGCAHNGILNILDRYLELFGSAPDAVVSGFHMKKSAPYTDAELETIRTAARELQEWPCRFYTCHCTGLPAFEMMKAIMGEKLQYLHGGEGLNL